MSFVNLYLEIEQYLGDEKYQEKSILLSSDSIEAFDNESDIQTNMYLSKVLDSQIKEIGYDEDSNAIWFITDMYGTKDEQISFEPIEKIQQNTKNELLNHVNFWLHESGQISYDITEEQLVIDNKQEQQNGLNFKR